MFGSPKKKGVSIIGSTNCGGGGVGGASTSSSSIDGLMSPVANNVVRRRDKSKLVNGGHKNPPPTATVAAEPPQKKKGNWTQHVHSRSIGSLLPLPFTRPLDCALSSHGQHTLFIPPMLVMPPGSALQMQLYLYVSFRLLLKQTSKLSAIQGSRHVIILSPYCKGLIRLTFLSL